MASIYRLASTNFIVALAVLLLALTEAVKFGYETTSDLIAADYVGESPGCYNAINGRAENFASIAGCHWEGGSICDRACVEIKTPAGAVLKLPVRDYCLCCNDNQIALSRPVFEQFGENTKQISWKLIKCNSQEEMCSTRAINSQAEANTVCPEVCWKRQKIGESLIWDGHWVEKQSCLGTSVACTCTAFLGFTLDPCAEPDFEDHPQAMLTCREVCKKEAPGLFWSGIWRPRAFISKCKTTTKVCTCARKANKKTARPLD